MKRLTLSTKVSLSTMSCENKFNIFKNSLYVCLLLIAFLTLSKNPISSCNDDCLEDPDGGTGSGTPGTRVGFDTADTVLLGDPAFFDTG